MLHFKHVALPDGFRVTKQQASTDVITSCGASYVSITGLSILRVLSISGSLKLSPGSVTVRTG
jgi:hypothetical protein